MLKAPHNRRPLPPKHIMKNKIVIARKRSVLYDWQKFKAPQRLGKAASIGMSSPLVTRPPRRIPFIKRSMFFYKNKLPIIGATLSKVSHLRFAYHFNWKLFRNRQDDSFALLDSTNLKLRKKYNYVKWGSGYQGWVRKYSIKAYSRHGKQRTKNKFKRTKLLLNKRLISSTNSLNPNKTLVSLVGVRRLPDFHIFKKKYLWGKPLVFTNGPGRSFGRTTNVGDVLLTSKIQFSKRKNVSRNLRKGKKPLRINSKFSRMSGHVARFTSQNTQSTYKRLISSHLLNTLKTRELLSSVTIKNSNSANYTQAKEVTFTWDSFFGTNGYGTVPTSGFTKLFNDLGRLDDRGTKLQVVNKVEIITKSKLNLTFINLSMFLVSKNFINPYLVNTRKYIWRKKINSFIYPNEYRSSLFFRKRKSFINNIFSNYGNYFSNFSKNNSILSVPKLLTRDTLSIYNKITSPQSRYTVPTTTTNSIDYRWNMTDRECHITRVRFKPGYQNLWRRVRGALKEYLGLRYIYQKQLTKHLTGFYVASNRYLWGCSEMSIFRTVLYSRLLPDNSAFNLFWDEKLIFLNGVLPSNKNTILAAGDLIQLVVSINYYITYRWLVSLTKERHRNMRKLVYRKGLARKYKLIKQRKQKSHYTPSWIYKNRFDFSDVKNFLEVDYFTLSAVVLYTPYMLSYHTYDNQLDLKINTFRLYNWKYIT